MYVFIYSFIHSFFALTHFRICIQINAANGIDWAEARLKIARMTLTIKRDGNWSSFQLANSALPLSVTSSAIAPSARMSHDVAKQCQLIAEEEA
tara:strand:- start:750 stop:1031 length:282 start_codon:yes stop_codon:yes gene_type:complete